MSQLFLSMYALIIILFALSFVFKKKVLRLVSLVLFLIFFVIPLCFVAFLGINKDQIIQGKMLSPKIGSLLLLAVPPEDLFVPLASVDLKADQREYEFIIIHKYVGNHGAFIKFRRPESMDEITGIGLKARLTVEQDGEMIYDKTSDIQSRYWGKSESGLSLNPYYVPDDLPVGIALKVKVFIEGDIGDILERFEDVKVVLCKGSDL
ncbi:hypothetical protein ACFL96_09575 [Thermoproteota archaeon]